MKGLNLHLFLLSDVRSLPPLPQMSSDPKLTKNGGCLMYIHVVLAPTLRIQSKSAILRTPKHPCEIQVYSPFALEGPWGILGQLPQGIGIYKSS